MQRFRRMAVAVAAFGCIGGASCSEDEPPVPVAKLAFPPAWAGVWRLTSPFRDCATDSVLGVDVYVDPICPGETLEEFLPFGEEGLNMDCTGSITDTEVAAHCTGSMEVILGVLTVTADFSATRTDSLFTGSGTASLRYQIGDDSETDCYEFTYDAVRIAPAPPDCSTTAKPLARALTTRLLRTH